MTLTPTARLGVLQQTGPEPVHVVLNGVALGRSLTECSSVPSHLLLLRPKQDGHAAHPRELLDAALVRARAHEVSVGFFGSVLAAGRIESLGLVFQSVRTAAGISVCFTTASV